MRANSPELDRHDWLRAVSADQRLLAVHRLALIGLGLRTGSPSCVASEIGLDLTTVLRATDAGRRRGWLADRGGRMLFTFPLTATAHEKENPADARAPPGNPRSFPMSLTPLKTKGTTYD